MTINELREKRNQAWEVAKAFVETKRDKDGLLSDEDAKTYAQMEKKVQDYGAEIERMEAMSAMDAQLSKPTSAPITEKAYERQTYGRQEGKRPDVLLMPIRTVCSRLCVLISDRYPMFSRRAWMLTAVISFPKSMIPALSRHWRRKTSSVSWVTPSLQAGERKINIAAKPGTRGLTRARNSPGGDAKFAQINLDAHKLHVAVKVTGGTSV